MHISSISGSHRFVGDRENPRQVIDVAVEGLMANSPVRVEGDAAGAGRADRSGLARVEAVLEQPALTPGRSITVHLRAISGFAVAEATGDIVTGEPGWTVHLISHFHYDPVWWSTQSAFLTDWADLPAAAAGRQMGGQHAAFDVICAHLQLAQGDPEYRFVLAEVDYLKPFWDARPQWRPVIRRLMSERRLEIVGGLYNEPNTNLSGAELTIRNALLGLEFQRGVLGADPLVGWQLDVFGHDPQFPALLRDAGLRYSSWARGPFHEWGPIIDPARVDQFREPRPIQFESEFDWIGPSGSGLLTSYMVAHYSAGWWLDSAPTLAEAEAELYRIFLMLKTTAATPHILVPMGSDHVRPNKWLTGIHEDWNRRYCWPRMVSSLPSDFFAAVEEARAADPTLVSVQTRDMNPVFTGKDVSYADTKQAQRAGESGLANAEKLATLAAIRGLRPFPQAEIDLAWRQLVYGAHHDAITGTESDQVYIDLLASWREAWAIARRVAEESSRALADSVVVPGPELGAVVRNLTAGTRGDVVVIDLAQPPGVVRAADGTVLPAVVEGSQDTGWRLSVVVPDVPGVGWSYISIDDGPPVEDWREIPGDSIANDRYQVTVDALRGGVITRLRDAGLGVDLIRRGGVGNEIDLQAEYPDEHDHGGLGPWHLHPTGPPAERSSQATEVVLRRQISAAGERLHITGRLPSVRYEQTITLWVGIERVECRTRLHEYAGSDRLLRVRWDAVPGGRPISEVGNAVVGRPFAHPHSDTADHPWTQDHPAHRWFGLGSTARFGPPAGLPFGVVEIVSADRTARHHHGGALALALVQSGVTATNSLANGVRYGDLDVDSNRPDLRISLGGPEENAFTRAALAGAPDRYLTAIAEQLDERGWAAVLLPAGQGPQATFTPGAAVTAPRSLPVLVVAGDLDAAVVALAADLDDHRIDLDSTDCGHGVESVAEPGGEPVAEHSIAVLNRGSLGYAVEPDGSLHLSLFRSPTGWPCGVWIDPPTRTVPDGSAFALQHWTHDIDYAVVSGPGDWRTAGFVAHGEAYNHPLLATAVRSAGPPQPPTGTDLAVGPGISVSAIKPARPERLRSTGHPEVVVRLYETGGSARPVNLDAPWAIGPVSRADLVEQPSEGDSRRLEPVETATLLLPVARLDMSEGPSAVRRFSPYWLHNAGPAPLGGHSDSVHLGAQADVTDNGLQVPVLVSTTATGLTDGRLSLTRLDTGTATFEEIPILLEDDGYTTVCFPVPTGPSTPIVVRADLTTDRGVYYDVAWYDTEDGHRLPAQRAATITAAWDRAECETKAQVPVTATLNVSTDLDFPVEAIVEFLSPWGTWEWLTGYREECVLIPGATTTLTVAVRPTIGTAGHCSWMIARVTAYGMRAYSPTISLRVLR